VLEVGCGAGRFTEVLLDAGARVFACDLSVAVEANAANCGARPGHFVCQADALALPAARGAFELVVALGMLQHTPSPERTIEALSALLKPGGWLVIDHYAPSRSPLLRALGHVMPRSVIRVLLLRLRPDTAFRFTQALADALLPLHRALWRRGPVFDALRNVWRRVSPVFDYYDKFPQLGSHLEEWARLDTHDGLTDRYKHLRTVEQIEACLLALGLAEVSAAYAGNGVEARARRPLETQTASAGGRAA
jgi:SAM-dependent methyltransferase